ncbi:MAG: hypothetical protein LBC65_03805 [Oscillospiraceae bacterium]|nr:hypothetical protein [Oscillospiraceae bacterium]
MGALLKMLLGFVGYVYKSFREYTEPDGSPATAITVRLTARERHRCPICGRKIKGK